MYLSLKPFFNMCFNHRNHSEILKLWPTGESCRVKANFLGQEDSTRVWSLVHAWAPPFTGLGRGPKTLEDIQMWPWWSPRSPALQGLSRSVSSDPCVEPSGHGQISPEVSPSPPKRTVGWHLLKKKKGHFFWNLHAPVSTSVLSMLEMWLIHLNCGTPHIVDKGQILTIVLTHF